MTRAAVNRAGPLSDGTRAELVDALGELGLSRTWTEGRLYVALAGSGRATAAELARSAGVPRPKAYQALASLEAHGLVSSILGRVNRYVALPAEEGPAAPPRGPGGGSRGRRAPRIRAGGPSRGLAAPSGRGRPRRRRRGLHGGDLGSRATHRDPRAHGRRGDRRGAAHEPPAVPRPAPALERRRDRRAAARRARADDLHPRERRRPPAGPSRSWPPAGRSGCWTRSE